MKRMIALVLGLLALGVGVGDGARADTALILANARYDAAPQMRSVRQIARLEQRIAAAGFDVRVLRDATAPQMREGLSRLIAAAENERVLVIAAGHFVRSRGESWLLGTEARAPDLAEVGGVGVPVSLLTEIAATAPGRAVVALATDGIDISTGAMLERGIGRTEPPQGVTVVAGAPDAVASFVSGPLLTPGTDIPDILGALPDLQATGFLSSAVPFLPERALAPPDRDRVPAEERSLWRTVEEIDTRAAYQAYLDRFPQGAYAGIARGRIAAAPPLGPEEQARAAEDALDLSRDARRQLQRYLTILSFDTRGVDGIFGPATRAAIRAWQADRGYPVTGYLSDAERAALVNEGTIREAVLAEERRVAEARDRAWWRDTGSGNTLEGMRAYLERYPDGLFADRARQAIAEAEEAMRDRAEAEIDAAWARAVEADTIAGYRGFIATYPDSRSAETARARIRTLRSGLTRQEEARAQAREAALNLPPITRLLVERRLARLGLDPGEIDGAFDPATRRAIRAYQRDRQLPQTGYLDETVLASLLAGSLNDILR